MLSKNRVCENCGVGFIYTRGMSYTKKNCSPVCHSESMSKARKTSKNPNWKGNKVKKHALHSWIKDNFTKNNVCEICHQEKRTEWSNKDHKYSRNKLDWQELCRKCHMQYDYKYLNVIRVGLDR